MFGVPVATPVTIPETEPTIANDVLILLHVPLPVASLKVTDEFTQILPPAPAIGDGNGLAVNVEVTEQPGVP
jgi:hypothetical protein